jgi:hypothetical protein
LRGERTSIDGGAAAMNRFEKRFVIFYWVYILVYIPCFFALVPQYWLQLLPFHFLGMVMAIPMFIIVFHDLYKRHFPDPNSKVTWAILMLVLYPSILVYLYKFGFRPREIGSS